MKIEQLWESMERDPTSGQPLIKGWLMRLAQPHAACPFFVALDVASGRRALLLRLPRPDVPPKRHWVKSKGLDTISLAYGEVAFWGVLLKEQRYTDVFVALGEDLVRRIANFSLPKEQAATFLGQLSRWQKFLSVSSEGLTLEEQRGLWGELRALSTVLIPTLGACAVEMWHGWQGADQDFYLANFCVEVKVSLAGQPQVVRISSERQLDDSRWGSMFLLVFTLEARAGHNETLPSAVNELRQLLAEDLEVLDNFEVALLEAGYVDAHSERYIEYGYLVREQSMFRVRGAFPRLTESDIPKGVGKVNYGLSIPACSRYKSSETMFRKALIRAKSEAARGA